MLGELEVSRLLLMLRWIGAIFVAFLVLVAVTIVGFVAVGAVLGNHTDTVMTLSFVIFFTSNLLAVGIGACVVPGEQRKAAALALWILLALYAFLPPALSGHLTGNILVFGCKVAGGGVAYFLATLSLLGGRKINRISNHSSQKGQPRNQEAGGDGKRPVPIRSMRRLTSLVIPLAFGVQALNMFLLHLRHPEIDGWLTPIIFWSSLFVGALLLRYWYRRRQLSKDIAETFT
jgi:hypothetical protein